MPLYRVQLKQGSRTIVNHIEAKSLNDLLSFYDRVSTMKVTEVLEVVYQNNHDIPIDDFNYKKLFKGYIRNHSSHKSKQIILHNLKPTINEDDLYSAIKAHLEIDGLVVDSVYCSLFKL